jgi:hypothetical protein
VVLIDSKRR